MGTSTLQVPLVAEGLAAGRPLSAGIHPDGRLSFTPHETAKKTLILNSRC